MRKQYGARLVTVVTVAALIWFAATQTVGQTRTGQIPRTSDGKPDFNGIWQANGSAHWDLEPHEAQPGPWQYGALFSIPAGNGVVEGGKIPYQPAAAARKRENSEKRWTDDPEIKCYFPGVPRANYMPYPFQIVQTPNNILIAYEYASANRVIPVGPQTEPLVDTWMGWSAAHWEGDSLVVDVTGFGDKTWFDRAGNFHSDALQVIERYTLLTSDAIAYEATIEDPKTFTRPWKISLPLYRRVEKDAQIHEFKCTTFAEELLYGHLRKQPRR